jgi:hypothetical protein
MRAITTVAMREVIERRAVFAVAAVLGILPIFVFQFNILGLSASAEIGTIAAGALFVALLGGLSLLVGASVIGRDLAERRIGFYLARPISDLTIWGGKFMGGLFIVLASSYLSLLPSAIFLGEARKIFFSLQFFSMALGAAVLLYSFGLIVGVAFRSKSKWLVLDLALIPVMALFAFPAIQRLAFTGTNRWYVGQDVNGSSWYDPYGMLAFGAVGVLVIILGASLPTSLISFIRGRADILRAHRVLSTSLWSIVFAGLLLFHGYSYWFVSADPSDIVDFRQVVAAPKGDWVAVSGTVSGREWAYTPTFLINTTTKQFYRFERPFDQLRISEDGKLVAWMQIDELSNVSPLTLYTMRLDDSSLEPSRTKITLPGNYGTDIFLSPDGSRVVVTREKLVSVFELPSGKELVTVGLPIDTPQQRDSRWVEVERAFFTTPDLIRIYRRVNHGTYDPQKDNPSTMELMELDVTAKKLNMTGKIETEAFSAFAIYKDKLVWRNKASIAFCDAKTGAQNAIVKAGGAPGSIKFLSDGRVAVAEVGIKEGDLELQQVSLRIFSAEGVEEKSLDLGTAKGVFIGGETSPGRLLVSLNTILNYSTHLDSHLFVVDINSGAITPRGEGLMPAISRYGGLISMSGNYMTRLFYNGKSIVNFNPETGESQTLITGAKN